MGGRYSEEGVQVGFGSREKARVTFGGEESKTIMPALAYTVSLCCERKYVSHVAMAITAS